jgi:hypothetical protein
VKAGNRTQGRHGWQGRSWTPPAGRCPPGRHGPESDAGRRCLSTKGPPLVSGLHVSWPHRHTGNSSAKFGICERAIPWSSTPDITISARPPPSREADSDPVRGARGNAVHAQTRASARFSTWKTRPTRSRVVYAQTLTRELLASFPWWPESYQPSGRRYWPAGSGSWLFCRSVTDSLAHQCRPAPAVAAPRRSPAR